MSQKFKPFEQKEEENDFDTGFKIPDTKSIQQRLLQQEHQQETEEDKKQGRPKKQKRGGSICCCQDPNCGIGPFVERSGD